MRHFRLHHLEIKKEKKKNSKIKFELTKKKNWKFELKIL